VLADKGYPSKANRAWLRELARNYRAAICLSATLIWIETDSINTA
jgi:hypothetical protein